MDETRKKHRRYRIAAFAILAFAYLWLFGSQTLFMAKEWMLTFLAPVTRITPTEIKDSSISQSSGTQLCYLGYQFQVPWDDVDPSKGVVHPGRSASVTFRSEHSLVMMSGPPHEFVDTLLTSTELRAKFERLFGPALHSDYEFHRLIWEATPAKSPFVPKLEAARELILLTLKSISAPRGAETGIFAVRTREFKGFQFGSPQKSPGSVDVELFSDTGSLDFIFLQKIGGPVMLTQSDINRVLSTLREAPHTAASTGSAKSQ
jgi:hypothetical protein